MHRGRIKPMFKASKASGIAYDAGNASAMMTCPACLAGEDAFKCELCDGAGAVTRRVAAGWQGVGG